VGILLGIAGMMPQCLLTCWTQGRFGHRDGTSVQHLIAAPTPNLDTGTVPLSKNRPKFGHWYRPSVQELQESTLVALSFADIDYCAVALVSL